MSYESCTCIDTRSVSLPYMGKYFFKYTGDGYLCGVIVYCTCSGDCLVFFYPGGREGGDGVKELITRGSSPISPRETTLSIPGSKHPLPIIPPGFLKLNLRTSNPTHVCAIYPSVRFCQWSVLKTFLIPDFTFYHDFLSLVRAPIALRGGRSYAPYFTARCFRCLGLNVV